MNGRERRIKIKYKNTNFVVFYTENMARKTPIKSIMKIENGQRTYRNEEKFCVLFLFHSWLNSFASSLRFFFLSKRVVFSQFYFNENYKSNQIKQSLFRLFYIFSISNFVCPCSTRCCKCIVVDCVSSIPCVYTKCFYLHDIPLPCPCIRIEIFCVM